VGGTGNVGVGGVSVGGTGKNGGVGVGGTGVGGGANNVINVNTGGQGNGGRGRGNGGGDQGGGQMGGGGGQMGGGGGGDQGGGGGGGGSGLLDSLASLLSGLGQAQATPAQQQQAAAPSLVPAQQAYAQPVQSAVQPAYAAQNGYTQIGPVGFKALALGWNGGGSWVVRSSPTLASASLDALQTCNTQFGECALSEAVVAPTAFGCLVVAQGADEPSRLFAATGETLDLARASTDTQMINAGLRGQIVYTGCNG
jgi:hypothetical protein